MRLHDYCGAIHIHSKHSDGSGSIPEIITAARKAGVDFLVLTDHSSKNLHEEGWQGWHDELLVIIAPEVGSTYKSHFIVFGLEDVSDLRAMPVEEAFREAKARGGHCFPVHPRGKRMPGMEVPGFSEWENRDYEGVEIWSYMHDWIAGCHLRNMREYIKHPDRYIAGPPPDVLQVWDRVAEKRRIVGLGALDNHAANLPFRKLPWRLFKVFPHEFCFRTIRTHVLIPPFSRKNKEDIAAFLNALRMGRCYLDYAPLGDGTGFRFVATQEDEEYHIGDEILAGSEVVFRIHSPLQAEITLLRNGLAEAAIDGTELDYTADGTPGVYRVEARIKGRPWLFTNHIYVRQQPAKQ